MFKVSTSPPIIILLDLLFVIIFILVINLDNGVTINIPHDKIFNNATLVYRSGNNVNFIVNKTNGRLSEDLFQSTGFSYYQKCTTQCEHYDVLYKDRLYIYFPDSLFNTISKLTYLATNTSYNCGNLQFDINQNGSIDKRSLFEENACLQKIPGFANLIE